MIRILAESFSELPQEVFELVWAERRPFSVDYLLTVHVKRAMKRRVSEEGIEIMECDLGRLSRVCAGPWRWSAL